MNNFPRITLQVHPYCNHRTFNPTCLYCADSQRVYREILDMQEQTKSDKTKIQAISASNDPMSKIIIEDILSKENKKGAMMEQVKCKWCEKPITYDKNGVVWLHENGYWCDKYLGHSATPSQDLVCTKCKYHMRSHELKNGKCYHCGGTVE